MLDPILQGSYDVILDSHALDHSMLGVRQPLLRELSGRFYNLIARTATNLPYQNTLCDFKAFRLAVCRPQIEGALLDRFGFEVELLYLVHYAGLRLRKQPLRENGVAGSEVGFLSGVAGFRELRQLGQLRRANQGHYEAAMQRARGAAGLPPDFLPPSRALRR